MTDPLAAALAATVRAARLARGLSAAELAERSGVSRAMIGKIEHGTVAPTAVLLNRLATALGLTLSELVARAEGGPGRRLVRADEQPTWTDPDTGYRRRTLSPDAGDSLQLVHIELPPHTEVAFDTSSAAVGGQQLWLLTGRLRCTDGAQRYELRAGDSLRFGPPASRTFANPGARLCRYLLAVLRAG